MIKLTKKEKTFVTEFIHDFCTTANKQGFDAGGFSITESQSYQADILMLEWRAFSKPLYPALKRKNLTLDQALLILKKYKIHRSRLFYNQAKSPTFSIEIKYIAKKR